MRLMVSKVNCLHLRHLISLQIQLIISPKMVYTMSEYKYQLQSKRVVGSALDPLNDIFFVEDVIMVKVL